jgi:putative hydrolase of the HAD superfamily
MRASGGNDNPFTSWHMRRMIRRHASPLPNINPTMITVVTIDFWNTLFDSKGGPERNAERSAALWAELTAAGAACEKDAFDSAYKGIWSYFDDHWLNHQRTPTSEEMVREICRSVAAELPEEAVLRAAEVFERGVLSHPPGLLPGVHEGLAYLKGRARLALISDTAFSPGSVLRELMEREGIDSYFDAYVFSDETGVAKPHPGAFSAALHALGGSPEGAFHIGDIERTDVRGAKEAGMKAVLYRGDDRPSKYAEEVTAADAVMDHWSQIAEIFSRLDEG